MVAWSADVCGGQPRATKVPVLSIDERCPYGATDLSTKSQRFTLCCRVPCNSPLAVAFSCTRARARSLVPDILRTHYASCAKIHAQNKETGADGGCSTHRDEVRRQRGHDYFETSETRKIRRKRSAHARTFLTDRGARCQQISACTTLHEQQPLTHTLGARTDDDICVGPLTRYSRRSLSVVQRSGSPALQPFARLSQFTCIYIHNFTRKSEKDCCFFFWP